MRDWDIPPPLVTEYSHLTVVASRVLLLLAHPANNVTLLLRYLFRDSLITTNKYKLMA